MTDPHRTPDELTTENELICERLLGWERCSRGFGDKHQLWRNVDDCGGWALESTPSFDAWAEAGLILNAFQKRGSLVSIQFQKKGFCAIDHVGSETEENIPAAIRAAALRYILEPQS